MDVLKIFVSSTFVDLSAVRAEICKWLTGLFSAELIVMETFGSDATPPEINSIRRVRECDLFVGIYAHRYGTIDETSGESITELELDEANAAFSAGTLRDILLFVINEDSSWLSEYKETEANAIVRVKRLAEKAKLHTYTPFIERDDLIFYVTRDVYRHVSQFLRKSPLKIRPSSLQPTKPLRRPIGMEYLTSEFRDYLFGRNVDISSVLTLLEENHMVLLLGESGVGKTSLIHAGLIPAAMTKGWRVVYCRPLGLPSTDITHQLLADVFEGRPVYRGPLTPLIGEILGSIQGQHLLIIMDQFEDILLSRDDGEVDNLLSDLRIFRNVNPPSASILLSYRSDLEGRLGQYWQLISGSALGLPRFYLKGVALEHAWESLERIAHSLAIDLVLKMQEKERIKKDLLSASNALGFSEVYPPYIQMTADHFWAASSRNKYHLKNYQKAGAMDGIMAGYLGRQMQYAQDTQGKLRAVLVSLVRSYGVKAQKEMKEIVADTAMSERECDKALEKLIDLRLVRHIPPYYEISHDFIARRIANELVDSEEREFKRFRELLTLKAAAFRTTHSLLTTEEQLILYKHRQRLIPTEEESHLLLSTWVRSRSPGLFWLLQVDSKKMISWLRAEEADEDLEAEAKASVVLLRRKLGEMPLAEKDYQAFRNYQLSAELSTLIVETALTIPIKLLVLGLRHRRKEVREACIASFTERAKHRGWDWIQLLRKSSSLALQQAYEELVLRPEVPAPEMSPESDKSIKEFGLLKLLGRTTSRIEARRLYKDLRDLRPSKRVILLAQSLLSIKQGRLQQLITKSRAVSRDKAKTVLKAPRCSPSKHVFNELVKTYQQWNTAESGRYDRASLNAKAGALSSTINAMMTPYYLSILRNCFKKIHLTSSSREIVLALLSFGNTSDVKLVLDRIARAKNSIDYWNHTELGRTAGRSMERSAKGIPAFLKKVITRKEFLEYIDPSEKKQIKSQDLLPLCDTENRALYIRIAAYSAIGSATSQDAEYLFELARHVYTLVSRAAAVKLVTLFGIDAFRMLSEKIDDAIKRDRSSSFSEALRYAEMEFYGVASLV
jgi:hypothetical protein